MLLSIMLFMIVADFVLKMNITFLIANITDIVMNVDIFITRIINRFL